MSITSAIDNENKFCFNKDVSPCGVCQHANDDNVHVTDDVSDWTRENLKSYFVKIKLDLTKA
jgi:hypothetical protein